MNYDDTSHNMEAYSIYLVNQKHTAITHELTIQVYTFNESTNEICVYTLYIL